METTKNEMSEYGKFFFTNLSNYLETKIYYYGSIQRYDFYPNSSDIDVDIFTDNINSTKQKIINFLEIKNYEIKRFVYKLKTSNKLVYGYKVKYENPINFFSTEISIYNENDKFDVLKEHNNKINLPIYVTILLVILKFMYYSLGIIPKDTFKTIKHFIINNLIDGEAAEFVTIDIPKHKDK